MPRIPELQAGARITGAGVAVVGELEPELVELPAGATVTPLSKVPHQRAGRDADKGRGNVINVHPARGMDELGLARIVSRELEWAAT